MNAKPPATQAAYTMPSTGPSKYLRAAMKITSRPSPLADSSTSGAWIAAPMNWYTCSLPWDRSVISGSTPSPTTRAMITATAAPQRNAKSTASLGSRSQRSIHRTPRNTMASGMRAMSPPRATASPPSPITRYPARPRARMESTTTPTIPRTRGTFVGVDAVAS